MPGGGSVTAPECPEHEDSPAESVRSALFFFFFFTGIPDDSAPAVNETGLRSR